MSYRRVHIYQELLLLRDLFVPLLHHLADPGLEFRADDAVGQIDDELLVELLDLLGNRHVFHELLVVADLREDLLDGEALVLRDVDVLDVLALDEFLGAGDEVLEKAGEMLAKKRLTY